MAEFNGFPSWNSWNVSLWILNDERLYTEAYELTKKVGEVRAARILSHRWEGLKTPHGAKFNHRSIRLAVQDIL
jgi:hypothetical protein